MSDNIVRLPGAEIPTNEPDSSIVGMLEGILERAKRGEVRAIALAAEVSDGGVATGWHRAAGGSSWALIGAVSLVKHRILRTVE